MNKMVKITSIAAVFIAMSGVASAYTGPGLGMATITVVLGFFASIFIALFAIVWYPIKRILKRRKTSTSSVPEADNAVVESSEGTEKSVE